MKRRYRIANKKRYSACITVMILILLGLVVLLFYRPIKEQVEQYQYPLAYESLVEKYSVENGLPPSLVYAVINCESSFQPDAVSSIGARGLMQMTSDTFDWVCYRLDGKEQFDDLFEPEVSIRYGTYLLRYLSDVFGSTEEVICAYHAGVNQVLRWLEDPAYSADGETLDTIPFDDTRYYLSKVTTAIEKYQTLYQIP